MGIADKYSHLPASGIAGKVNSLLGEGRDLVIVAEPGAGKSTLLPLTIHEASHNGKILMLEPRRIAARQIAARMSEMAGTGLGGMIGYRVRYDNKTSSRTEIEVVTEGILTRRFISDPFLDGVSTVIFDEFHERNLDSDIALALVRELKSIRDDLRLVIMSATIDSSAIADELGAVVIQCEGKMFPVEIVHSSQDCDQKTCVSELTKTILEAYRNEVGSILAFLPGEAQIKETQERLLKVIPDANIHPLYGMLPMEKQREAIAPCRDGNRKIVLATPIAETSLTIEGVRIVVDSGLFKKMSFDPKTGLDRLDCCRISMDMAKQRSGRAGRIEAGKCYRLWSRAGESRMEECRKPEILTADLAPALLMIAAWGGARFMDLPWLTLPPKHNVLQALTLLQNLGAVDEDGTITSHGRKLAAIPSHPRIANMILKAKTAEEKALAENIATILEEKDPLAGGWECGLDLRIKGSADPYVIGELLAAAYPERIAKAQGAGVFYLSGGGKASMDINDSLSDCEWIVIASLSVQDNGNGRIFLAAPINAKDLPFTERTVTVWDSREGKVLAQKERRVGKLLLDAVRDGSVTKERIESAIVEAAPKEGLSMFDFNDNVRNLQRRIDTVREWHPELDLPDVSDSSILENCGEWLPVFGKGFSTAAELKRIDLSKVIWSRLPYETVQAVERLAPECIEVPTGSHIKVEYRQGADAPVLRVRLQECFGMLATPRVDNGKRPVLMDLLSPGFKSVQLTSDLESFWDNAYFEIRKELKRRYPKHAWPDNPREAEAVRGVRKK